MFSRWRERLFFLTTDSLVSIDTEGRRLGDHAFLEVDCDAIVCKHGGDHGHGDGHDAGGDDDDDGEDIGQVPLASVERVELEERRGRLTLLIVSR